MYHDGCLTDSMHTYVTMLGCSAASAVHYMIFDSRVLSVEAQLCSQSFVFLSPHIVSPLIFDVTINVIVESKCKLNLDCFIVILHCRIIWHSLYKQITVTDSEESAYSSCSRIVTAGIKLL